MTHALKRDGIKVNHKKVLKLMKEMGIQCKKRSIFAQLLPIAPQVKDISQSRQEYRNWRVGQLWCADITYIRILTAFVYLAASAAIIDSFSRKIVGYTIGRTLAAELTLEALKRAIKDGNTGDLIHHLDRGIQYASYDYVAPLESKDTKISMSAKGSPYDNAIIESFFKTLKSEEVYLWEYETYRDVISSEE